MNILYESRRKGLALPLPEWILSLFVVAGQNGSAKLVSWLLIAHRREHFTKLFY